ncbi:trypsin-like serine peptidase [Phaeacidiphilus oryzae]|uniref:trypsin-like serine peptidase n=1 Tax=Phaeacidiphilus oryzae TaxID=348818 RepID=UPI00055C90F8|nr:trypsin-like peptidase domain-containing protein [Phaeacidiphilus oryzae]
MSPEARVRRRSRAVRGLPAVLVWTAALLAPAACSSTPSSSGASSGISGTAVAASPSQAQTWSPGRLERARAAHRPGVGHNARPTQGNLRIGAIFDHDSSGDHFCSGSVVDSAGRNLVITAAHCIHGGKGQGFKSDVVFVPGYRSGQEPNGQWQVASLIVDPRWADSSDPDLDVAFLVLRKNDGRNIEDVLGGNRLGIDTGFDHRVRITGYPSSADAPVTCVNRTSRQSSTQTRIACTGFPGGTSGSPWVTAVDPATHTGTVIGVIGGYQEGGDTDSVSYSAYFGSDVQALYRRAEAAGG